MARLGSLAVGLTDTCSVSTIVYCVLLRGEANSNIVSCMSRHRMGSIIFATLERILDNDRLQSQACQILDYMLDN